MGCPRPRILALLAQLVFRGCISQSRSDAAPALPGAELAEPYQSPTAPLSGGPRGVRGVDPGCAVRIPAGSPCNAFGPLSIPPGGPPANGCHPLRASGSVCLVNRDEHAMDRSREPDPTQFCYTR